MNHFQKRGLLLLLLTILFVPTSKAMPTNIQSTKSLFESLFGKPENKAPNLYSSSKRNDWTMSHKQSIKLVNENPEYSSDHRKILSLPVVQKSSGLDSKSSILDRKSVESILIEELQVTLNALAKRNKNLCTAKSIFEFNGESWECIKNIVSDIFTTDDNGDIHIKTSGDIMAGSISIKNRTINELALIDLTQCNEGDVLQFSEGGWNCVSLESIQNTVVRSGPEMILKEDQLQENTIFSVEEEVASTARIKEVNDNNQEDLYSSASKYSCFEVLKYEEDHYRAVINCNCLQSINDDPARLEWNLLLTQDINCESISDFTTLGGVDNEYKGIFDGQGYSIEALSIEDDRNYIGLFSGIELEGQVKNLKFQNPIVKSSGAYTGVIAGDNQGIIKNISIENATVENDGGSIGGLVGANNATIENVYVTGTVTSKPSGTFLVGGIAGANNGERGAEGVIKNSYADVAVYGDFSTGGFVGHNSGEIYASFSVGPVLKANGATGGGFIGSSNSIRPQGYNYWYSPPANLFEIAINSNDHDQVLPERIKSLDLLMGADSTAILGWPSVVWEFPLDRFPEMK